MHFLRVSIRVLSGKSISERSLSTSKSKPVNSITLSKVSFLFNLYRENFFCFLLNLNNALFVNKYLGPPGLYILSLETPGAEI